MTPQSNVSAVGVSPFRVRVSETIVLPCCGPEDKFSDIMAFFVLAPKKTASIDFQANTSAWLG